MKKSKLLSVSAFTVLLFCILSLGVNAYFADVNQYNDLPGEYEANENGTQVPAPQPRGALTQPENGSEPLNVAVAVILSVLGGAASLAVILGVAARAVKNTY